VFAATSHRLQVAAVVDAAADVVAAVVVLRLHLLLHVA
jgi:hypothetical protein